MSQMLIPNTVTEACQMLSSGNRVACAGATNLYVDREKGKYLDRDIVQSASIKRTVRHQRREGRLAYRQSDNI